MNKSLIFFALIAFASPFTHAADVSPQCAPTGGSCGAEPCCSVTDYCHVNGLCTPFHASRKISSEVKSLFGDENHLTDRQDLLAASASGCNHN